MSRKNRANKSNLTDRYTGDLATPIYMPVVVGGPNESEAEFKQRLLEQRALKLNKLFDWHAIDPDGPDAGMHLALELAMAHVPGMQVHHEPRKRRGRKRTWKDGLGSKLRREVAALQRSKNVNYKQAIAELRENKEKPWRTYTLSNLITRHREARKVEQDGGRLFKYLMALPLSNLGAMFGMGRTDETSSGQN
jgi:hypothetical protein